MDIFTTFEVNLERRRFPRHPLNTYVQAYMFEIFLYGIHLILFVICVSTLIKKRPSTRKLYLATAFGMFSMSTASVCLSMYNLFGFLLPGKRAPFHMRLPKFLLYILNNAVLDILMISRCYSVWSNCKTVIILPCLLLVSSCITGFVFVNPPKNRQEQQHKLDVYLWINISLNILVTLLTAIRIWWTAHQVTQTLGRQLSKKYYSALAIIIESGAMYSLYILLDQLTNSFILDNGLNQVVGIFPTLIIVQVGLGRQARDLETTVSFVCADSSMNATRIGTTENRVQDSA